MPLILRPQLTLGPLSLATAYLTTRQHPLRYSLGLVVSAGHVYSDLLYFMTATYAERKHGIAYSRPELVYFWIYYVFMNALWIVVPLCKANF